MTNRTIREAVLRTYAPVSKTSLQARTSLKCSRTYEILTDESGNDILHFQLDDLPPHAARIIAVEAQLAFTKSPKRVNADVRKWLQPETHIESADPAISSGAAKFMTGKPVETAEKISKWVSGHVRYCGYTARPRGALYAWRHRMGDCTEFMYLFVAMCRAAGIPARGVGGFIQKSDGLLKPEGYHNWAEFYADGAWHIADPMNRIFNRKGTEYVAMHILQPSNNGKELPAGMFAVDGKGVNVGMNAK